MLSDYRKYKEAFMLYYIENNDAFDDYKKAIKQFNQEYNWADMSPNRPCQFECFLIFEEEEISPVELSNVMKSIELAEEAKSTTDSEHRQRLILKALEYWPDNFEAMRYVQKDNVYEKIIYIRSELERVEASLAEDPAVKFFKFSVYSFNDLNIYLAELYMKNCLYPKAKEILLSLESVSSHEAEYIGALLMICNVYTGDYEDVIASYHTTTNQQTNSWYLLPTFIAAVLVQDEELSFEIFQQLMRIYPKEMETLFISGSVSTKRIKKLIHHDHDNTFYESLLYLYPLISGSEVIHFYFDSTYLFLKSETNKPQASGQSVNLNQRNIIQFPGDDDKLRHKGRNTNL
ncbi:hypothetical protein HZY86_04050 [Aerococcaceae bacterium DSM 111020]|nr:hypothetical protein [Aerococcaceae bacterium DSM 111020]